MAENQTTDKSTQGIQGSSTQGSSAQGAQHSGTASRQKSGPLHTDQGDTTIAETVVQKLAGMATREVPGVHAMGSAGRRAFDQIAERIPGSQTNVSGGVSVEKGERQTAIDISVVAEYGASIVDMSQNIRRNVINSVERATGLEVIEVNVNVTDVHLPEDDTENDDSGVKRSRENELE
ncbi:putative alkaline shock family protein YloU [Arthrobacter sp. CAN_A212]|uniref:Asp23/Gls24 family envelope stress response protein n=1 Tax=Arthrobacter sp. CAN_A212 TaxID=2787719 RepID=UPI0018C97116